jgi:signal transduction histidine kinase
VDAFTRASHELDVWIDAQKPKLTSVGEKAFMNQIDGAYDEYLTEAKALLARLPVTLKNPASVDEYTDLRAESQHLFDLGQNLSRAHYDSRNQLLNGANRTIGELRGLVLISLSMLFALALVLAFVVYRDMVLPLRVQLVESQILLERQEKLASLGALAAGVAHEIRNPLTAIKAALFVQQKKIQPGTREAADARVVDREILRLERIVNDFLLLARPGESKLESMTADVPLREVHALLVSQLAANNIQLVLGETPHLPIRADADQIKQVLINLVRNAAEASPPNGVVKLSACSGHKRLAGKDSNVVILEVTDHGNGIPAEVQKRLFDPFFTTKETGTGLGLSIAAQIVHAHGGVLQFQTAPNQGTTFGVVLPAGVS